MIKTFIILVLFLFLSLAGYGQLKEEKLVRQAFDKYRSAILNDKGDEAVKFVDSRTIKYFGNVLELVNNADSIQVESLSVLDKLMVLTIRHSTPKDIILSLDGKGLLVYAVKSGMVGKNSVANNSIGEITIDNYFAKGQILVSGQKTPYYFHFYNEDTQWKVDITSIFPISNSAIKKMVDESGHSENEYLFSLMEVIDGKKPGKVIWEKVN
jgi:hypothetical protein